MVEGYRGKTEEEEEEECTWWKGTEAKQRKRKKRSVHGGSVQRQNRGRERRGQGQRCISDEIRATIVDHVVNHGLTMAEGCS